MKIENFNGTICLATTEHEEDIMVDMLNYLDDIAQLLKRENCVLGNEYNDTRLTPEDVKAVEKALEKIQLCGVLFKK